jgi:uncharacterized membrane protein YphA (DoxX/SURF4 family)
MTKDEIAYLLLRVTLGANLFLHGFSRLIGNHATFAAYMENQMHNAPLPGFLVHFVTVVFALVRGDRRSFDDSWTMDVGRSDRR